MAIVSLILNLFTSYLREGLDRFLPRVSSRLGSWAQRKAGEFRDDIERASGDITLMTYLSARQASYHISALHYYILSFFFFYLSGKVTSPEYLQTILGCGGALFAIVGGANYGRAMRCKTILDAVERKTKK